MYNIYEINVYWADKKTRKLLRILDCCTGTRSDIFGDVFWGVTLYITISDGSTEEITNCIEILV